MYFFLLLFDDACSKMKMELFASFYLLFISYIYLYLHLHVHNKGHQFILNICVFARWVRGSNQLRFIRQKHNKGQKPLTPHRYVAYNWTQEEWEQKCVDSVYWQEIIGNAEKLDLSLENFFCWKSSSYQFKNAKYLLKCRSGRHGDARLKADVRRLGFSVALTDPHQPAAKRSDAI